MTALSVSFEKSISFSHTVFAMYDPFSIPGVQWNGVLNSKLLSCPIASREQDCSKITPSVSCSRMTLKSVASMAPLLVTTAVSISGWFSAALSGADNCKERSADGTSRRSMASSSVTVCMAPAVAFHPIRM